MRKVVFVVAVLLMGGVAAISVAGFWVLRDLPTPALIADRIVAQSTKIYDRTRATLLYEIHGGEKRTVVPLREIPKVMLEATLAAEDANFYGHPAFDWRSIVRALLVNLRRGGIVQGGSTITQQLAKNAFLTPERTLTRKLKELALSFELEREFTKDEILELYLNQVPYGANSYGIEAAAQTYFGKSVRDVTAGEAAFLAALPKAPSYYSPWGSHKEEALARKDYVLTQMRRAGRLTEEEAKAAQSETLAFLEPSENIRAPHFVLSVVEYLNSTYGEEFVRAAGLTVVTTLDLKLQELAERVVREGAARNEELYKGTNAALVAEDAKTGEVLALVGSRDYFDVAHEGNFNVATQGLRQPGSAFKPFAYVTAFQKGYTPETVLVDAETEFDATGDPEKSYKPSNFDGQFRGPLTLRQALAQSVNIPAVKTLYLAGVEHTIRNAEAFGITTLGDRSRFGLSLVLGGGEVKLAELVGAYSVFAQEGIHRDQAFVREVRRGTKLLEAHEPVARTVIDPQYPRIINDILSDVDARRPLFQNSLPLTVFPGHQVAFKTGTSNDYRDAWTIGYTPSLVAGVWAGNNDNTPMERRGGSILAAVPIWSAFMREALQGRPLETFTKPQAAETAKPILRGTYVLEYRTSTTTYPQLHTILSYAAKENPQGPAPEEPEQDPQFKNWEEGVVRWGSEHIPDFALRYNKPIPPEAKLVEDAVVLPRAALTFLAPRNGDFVTIPLEVRFTVGRGAPVKRIELFVNNVRVAEKSASFAEDGEERMVVTATPLAPQNELRLVAWDNDNRSTEERVIVYR